jgi:hypothetical protein
MLDRGAGGGRTHKGTCNRWLFPTWAHPDVFARSSPEQRTDRRAREQTGPRG